MAMEFTGDANLAAVGAALGNRPRARVLLALADGRALCASVLAGEAGVSAPTISHHLTRLVGTGLVNSVDRGRHRYFAISGPRVAELIEAAARLAPAEPVTSLRQGTRASAIRYARTCYDHLAGRLGVAVTNALLENAMLDLRRPGVDPKSCALRATGEATADPPVFSVTELGASRLSSLGVETEPGDSVRGCLDWTEQRYHVAGQLGRGLLTRFLTLGWVARSQASRAVQLTTTGGTQLRELLGVEIPVPEGAGMR